MSKSEDEAPGASRRNDSIAGQLLFEFLLTASAVTAAYLVFLNLAHENKMIPLAVALAALGLVYLRTYFNIKNRAKEMQFKIDVLAKNIERLRTARDIHESLGQSLSTLTLQLEVATSLQDKDPGKAHEALETARALSRTSLNEIQQAFKLDSFNSYQEQP